MLVKQILHNAQGVIYDLFFGKSITHKFKDVDRFGYDDLVLFSPEIAYVYGNVFAAVFFIYFVQSHKAVMEFFRRGFIAFLGIFGKNQYCRVFVENPATVSKRRQNTRIVIGRYQPNPAI